MNDSSITFEKALIQFSKEMLSQIEGKAERTFFIDTVGLCTNFWNYLYINKLPISFDDNLFDLFKKTYRYGDFPFNPHKYDYGDEVDSRSLYKNPLRMEFLKQWASK